MAVQSERPASEGRVTEQDAISQMREIASDVIKATVAHTQRRGLRGTYNECLEAVFLAFLTILQNGYPAEERHTLSTEYIERINNSRPYFGDPSHCESCSDLAEVSDHLSQKIGVVDNRAFVIGVSVVLRTFIEAIGDNDHDGDLIDLMMDHLFPEPDQDTRTIN